MRSSLLFLACALFGVNGLAHGVARHGLRLNARGVRSAVLTMAEDPKVMFDQGHGWKPPKGGGGDPHGGSQFEATDTPDFFDESEESQMAGKIDVMDGVLGSTGLDKLNKQKNKHSDDPGVKGALDVNPEVFEVEAEELSASKRGIVFELPKSGMTDLDFDMECDSTKSKELTIDVRPVAMTFEEFYCGFTEDSHPSFSVTPTEGKMERRNGPPTTVTVTCKPNSKRGDLVAHLCFILPEEKAFSTYYKITCKSF